MKDNSIISDARGECRHVRYDYINTMCGGSGKCLDCGHLFDSLSLLEYDSAQYDSDLEAWTPELYQWIEDEGLWQAFILILCKGRMGWIQCECCKEIKGGCKGVLAGLLRATPAQKASALAQAIKERA